MARLTIPEPPADPVFEAIRRKYRPVIEAANSATATALERAILQRNAAEESTAIALSMALGETGCGLPSWR